MRRSPTRHGVGGLASRSGRKRAQHRPSGLATGRPLVEWHRWGIGRTVPQPGSGTSNRAWQTPAQAATRILST